MKKIISLITVICMTVLLLSGCVIEKKPEQGTKVSKSKYEETVWNFIYGKTGNPYGTAGLMANLYAESNLNPKNLQNSYEKKLGMNDEEYTAAVDNGTYTNFVKDSAGYGIAQWTFWSRKQGLLEYAKEKGTSVGDINTQLEYLWKELSGYKSVVKTLKEATDVKTASDKVLVDFERPANMGDSVKNKRASVAQTFFDKYGEEPV